MLMLLVSLEMVRLWGLDGATATTTSGQHHGWTDHWGSLTINLDGEGVVANNQHVNRILLLLVQQLVVGVVLLVVAGAASCYW